VEEKEIIKKGTFDERICLSPNVEELKLFKEILPIKIHGKKREKKCSM